MVNVSAQSYELYSSKWWTKSYLKQERFFWCAVLVPQYFILIFDRSILIQGTICYLVHLFTQPLSQVVDLRREERREGGRLT